MISAPVPGINGGANLSVDLSGDSALQATLQNITFRIYLWGCIQYGCTGLGGLGNELVVTGNYQFEISPDLSPGSWVSITSSPQVTSIDTDWERVVGSISRPSNESRSFLRIRVLTND